MSAKRFLLVVMILIGALALVACNGGEVEPGAEEQVAPEAEAAARAALADFLGVDPEALELEQIEDAEWPDGCLGLGGPAESCLAAITPGYAITYSYEGESYVVRTDLEGNAVRAEAEYPQQPEAGDERPAAVEAARDALALELGVPLSTIEVVSFEEAEWTDSCLGLGGPAESCLTVITPGWRVMLDVEGQVYEVRTDETGETVRIADPDAG